MAWLISLLGSILAVAGAVSLGNGAFYIRLDWGQAETVAGAVGLSGGVVTIGLSAVLFALRDLQRRPARPAAAGVGLEALTLDDAPAPARAEFKPAPVGVPRAERVEPLAEAPARDLDAPAAGPPPMRATPPNDAAPVSPPRERPIAEAPPAAAAAFAEAPTVVGRYEANGASYVLFSDGTIEVETESGTHRFDSMAALKQHIERQEAV